MNLNLHQMFKEEERRWGTKKYEFILSRDFSFLSAATAVTTFFPTCNLSCKQYLQYQGRNNHFHKWHFSLRWIARCKTSPGVKLKIQDIKKCFCKQECFHFNFLGFTFGIRLQRANHADTLRAFQKHKLKSILLHFNYKVAATQKFPF